MARRHQRFCIWGRQPRGKQAAQQRRKHPAFRARCIAPIEPPPSRILKVMTAPQWALDSAASNEGRPGAYHGHACRARPPPVPTCAGRRSRRPGAARSRFPPACLRPKKNATATTSSWRKTSAFGGSRQAQRLTRARGHGFRLLFFGGADTGPHATGRRGRSDSRLKPASDQTSWSPPGPAPLHRRR